MISSCARLALVGALAFGLVACGEKKPAPKPVTNLYQADCYTVDPYQPIRIEKPAAGVPEDMKAFLGAWGGGAWDGSVCHDLWVMNVDPSGNVLMFDAHGPGFFPDATAFTRKGRISPEGKMRVRKGPAVVEYWIADDGRLHGTRTIGKKTQHVIMSRRS
ncbi:hypothetical protein [uncultured Albimonas sp.]|uniref:hypothetical protein n=1 Tax=uncultured Albimonas sp. TaxID=1331701 RepID=UPI0030EC5F12|tara:strand:+ start:1951 stop:2430 length:480 start_codon:yes stop_codon:yes gene_type:complete